MARSPEPIELQVLPQRERQPTAPAWSRPIEAKPRELQRNDRGGGQKPVAAIFPKERKSLRPIRRRAQHLDQTTPAQFLRVVDLAQMQHMPLHHWKIAGDVKSAAGGSHSIHAAGLVTVRGVEIVRRPGRRTICLLAFPGGRQTRSASPTKACSGNQRRRGS